MMIRSDSDRNGSAPVSLLSPEQAVGFVLWRVLHRYQREVDRALISLGITHLQFAILAMGTWLAADGSRLTQSALAAASGIHPMQLSSVLKALEHKLLVTRRTAPSNLRSKIVMLSPQGITTVAEALPLVIAVQRRVFGKSEAALMDILRSIETPDAI
ncbi:MarR family winged helix-turn-helix transcriptional regulator [Glacieibacterium megasporae]|uniref:MarR family winged helix-turn-helix transcriptional regulator n=1 Tax=Glacieibacterium megasporae TaxID=2835787 RepID=UPI001C1E0417|nr:MarR family winged helix-turn-helix transcriptional regulator [Polymorphobacter megasporae]UAJ10508.1 MarR family winged helix-turn-helix transcriptional regulator [Polymorphobacter megasporae]